MDRNDVLALIEERFRLFQQDLIDIEELHSYVRDVVNQFGDEICEILGEVKTGIDKLRMH